MKTVKLTAAQALVRFMLAQKTEIDGQSLPFFAAVWAIFGHGNVAALGEALHAVKDTLPTYRAHNEQGMAHAALAFTKAKARRQVMACTTSIGPGATNMITAAALAHVNRLPVLFIPGDVFASRRPDPVLQQVESFADGTVSANDCFKPVSRYFDRIMRPEQLINALPQMMRVLTDPTECGPVTLAFCQDTQAESFDYPATLFEERLWTLRRPQPDLGEVETAVRLLKKAKQPLIIAGGGVLYSGASLALRSFVETHAIPVCETQSGKSALPHDHALNMGSIGVTGTSAANDLAQQADVIVAIGTRLQDFTTGSWSLFQNPKRTIIQLNISSFDAVKHFSQPLICDVKTGLAALSQGLKRWRAPQLWHDKAKTGRTEWLEAADCALAAAKDEGLPSDAEVIGAVLRVLPHSTVVCAAGGLPGELHKLWRAQTPHSYHVEYGYSTMGYEIAGGLGVKMAQPDRDVVVMVGDGSYLMLNSEIATSIMLGQKLIITVLDNRGFGCINRLQRATGSESFNNLLQHTKHESLPDIDFAAHAKALGAEAVKVNTIAEMETALHKARTHTKTSVIVINTDPMITTQAGGTWWEVAVPEVSQSEDVKAARKAYDQKLKGL